MATPWSNLPISMTLSWKFFSLQASPATGQSLQQKEKEKKEKRKKKSKIKKPKYIVHFLVQNSCPSQNVIKCDASGKKGTLLCCQCLLDQIEANLAEIQPENHQKCPKNAFLAKSSGSQWVKNLPESSKRMSCKTSQMHMWKSHNLYNRKMLMTFKV